MCMTAVESFIVLAVLFSPVATAAQVLEGPVKGMEFVELSGGPFEYGRIEDAFGNVIIPGNTVSLRSFQIMTTEVTQSMWETVMGEDVALYLDSTGIVDIGPEYPMCMVSLEDCRAFADSLSNMDSLFTYLMLTDRYWTYACAAGTYTPYPWGNDTLETMAANCWYSLNSSENLHSVGSLAANQWGLHDMCGNVYEWTTVSGGVELGDPETGETLRGQIVRGGSAESKAYQCRRVSWLTADSTATYADVGFRVARLPRTDGIDKFELSQSEILQMLLREDRFAFFIEPALAIGGISHSFNEDDIQQLGYNVKGGCEQDCAYLRIGMGKHFSRFGAFIYGEAGHIAPGVLFDNHGPWILPEVLLRMNMVSGGLELRYYPVRVRLGYGRYSGEAEIDFEYDTTETSSPSGSWTTDIVEGRGFSYGIGIHIPVSEKVAAGVEWSQHFIDLKLAESGTGVEPSDHTARQSELRFFVNFQSLFEL